MGICDGLTLENAAELAGEFIERKLPRETYPRERFAGRGIVMAAGGLRYMIPAWVAIRALRHVGCTLPIELWYRGAGERVPAIEHLLKPYGVEFVDAYAVRDSSHPHARLGGWEMKPYAIQWSRFAEVLLLDADNVVCRDPEYLFNTPQYGETGFLVWPDYHVMRSDRTAWQAFGVPWNESYQRQVESGQVVVDKARNWPALCLVDWYGQRSEFFFSHVHGDTGLFHLPWLRLGMPYAMTPHRIRSLKGTMCQHDFDGHRVFQHRNSGKWAFERTIENDHRPGFILEPECFGWLDELRAIWNPASGEFASEADIDAQGQYIGRAYTYTRFGSDGLPRDARRMILGSGGLIGDGANKCEKFWCVRGNRLQIADNKGKPIMDLQEQDGVWCGRWLQHEKMPVELRPIS
jgi:hypothetical protein